MNWIDKYGERIVLGNEGLEYILKDIAKEAKAQGAQEALAKVEEWVRRNKKSWIDGEHVPQEAVIADDLLHHLQQLKDNKTV